MASRRAGAQYDELRDKAIAIILSRLDPQQKGRGHQLVPPLPLLPILRPPCDCESRPPNDFKYQPLHTSTSIRLLKVFPVDLASRDMPFNLFQPPIRCSMVEEDLGDRPKPYDALSYTWGDPCTLYSSADEISPPAAWSARAFDILIDEKPVSVATNLYTALLSFRFFLSQTPQRTATHHGYSDLLWIDALCINQSNHEERTSQVLMMDRIYRQSTTVFVWLGGGDRFSKQAILNLNRIFNLKIYDAKLKRMISSDILNETTYEQAELPLIDRDSWVRIYMFLSRAWFQRAWVVQEVAFAKNAVALCGTIQFNLNMIIGSLMLLNRVGWIHQAIRIAEPLIQNNRDGFHQRSLVAQFQSQLRLYRPRRSGRMRRNFGSILLETRASLGIQMIDSLSRTSRFPLVKLLLLHRFLEATDPRDKVYAFWGMSKEAQNQDQDESNMSPQFRVDYKLSVREVYVHAASFIVTSSKDLSILSLKESETSISGLPSWVPDLSTGSNAGLAVEAGCWTASLGLRRANSFTLEADKLQVSGFKVSSITKRIEFAISELKGLAGFLRDIPESDVVHCPQPMDLDEWEKLHGNAVDEQRKFDFHRVKQSRFEILWRTLNFDCFDGRHPAPPECGAAILDVLNHELQRRQIMAVLVLLCESDNLETRVTGDAQEPLNRFLDYEQAKEEVGRYYVELQEILGHKAAVDGEIILPPEFECFETRRANSTKERLEAGVARDFFDELNGRQLSSYGGQVMASLGEKLISRDLFITEQGYLGFGMMSLEVGDEVWILAGARVPLILRRRAEEGQYRLIGETYVHGIMHGEAVNDMAKANMRKIILT